MIEKISSEEYDQIINLSFSPLSSYLTHALSHKKTKVFGFTRFSDGYLSIPDDASAYFYGQVGIGKKNRVHLSDIFSTVAGVDIKEQDWRGPEPASKTGFREEEYIVVHVGTSESRKTYGEMKWRQVLSGIRRGWSGKIIMVGSSDEKKLSDKILDGTNLVNIENLVGSTKIYDLFEIIGSAQLVVGCDSVAMQMASLTNTACVCLTFSSVNFWETGPRASGSVVLYADESDLLASDRVSEVVLSTLSGKELTTPIILSKPNEIPAFQVVGHEDKIFCWDLIKAIYMEDPFPIPQSQLVYQGIARLKEVSHLALEQLNYIADVDKQAMAAKILDQVDDIIGSIEKMVPELSPLVSWFQVEKQRIGPGSFEEILYQTKTIFGKLNQICGLYIEEEQELPNSLGGKNAEINLVE